MDGNQTASLSSLLARKATFLLALISDRFASRRIATHAGGTIPHLQNPKSNDLHALAHYQVLCDHADEVFHQFQGLPLVELMLLRQLIRQMFGVDRLWGCQASLPL